MPFIAQLILWNKKFRRHFIAERLIDPLVSPADSQSVLVRYPCFSEP